METYDIMNLEHLKYIFAIEKYGSISMAARQLYVAQPNLSRAVKEFEDEYGIKIFERTSKGVEVTHDGRRFIEKLKDIQKGIDSLFDEFVSEKNDEITFKVSVPRATYISDIFAKYIQTIGDRERIAIRYSETNSIQTIQNVIEHDYDIGIIRYAKKYEKFYKSRMKYKGIEYEKLKEFDFVLTMNRNNPLAHKDEISEEDLKGQIELVHGDDALPNGSYIDIDYEINDKFINHKRIYIYERGSQYEIMSNVCNSYMWSSEVPQNVLDRWGMVQRQCKNVEYSMRDYIIYTNERRHKCDEFINYLKESLTNP